MRQLKITQTITNRESQSVDVYLNEIGKVDLISAEEEVILAQKIREGDQAALERLTQTNLRFVVSVAKKYLHQGLPLSDLISEGNLGLIKAAQRFDETKGFKFISYAVWWIRQSIMLAINEHSRMIRLPMNQVGTIVKMNKALSILEQQAERAPTVEELALWLDTSEEKVSDALTFSPKMLSYDSPIRVGEEYSLLDILPNGEKPTDGFLMEESTLQQVDALLASLTEREQEVIKWSFGLHGVMELSPLDIGKKINLSKERVRQIRNTALEKMQQTYGVICGDMRVGV
jgi:RNA polymerase primary sigma factor